MRFFCWFGIHKWSDWNTRHTTAFNIAWQTVDCIVVKTRWCTRKDCDVLETYATTLED